MKRRLFFIISFFMIFGFVYAEGDVTTLASGQDDLTTCSYTTKSDLMKEAYNLVFTYEEEDVTTYEEYDSGEWQADSVTESYIDIKIYNVTANLNIVVTNLDTDKTFTLNYRNMQTDGSLTIRKPVNSFLGNYEFKVYGLNDCTYTTLRTAKLTLPRYNHLSGMGMCEDLQDYYLCQRLVTYDIDENTAYGLIQEYKESLLNTDSSKKIDDEDIKSSNVIEKITSKKNYIIFIVLGLGFIITAILLVKRKKER